MGPQAPTGVRETSSSVMLGTDGYLKLIFSFKKMCSVMYLEYCTCADRSHHDWVIIQKNDMSRLNQGAHKSKNVKCVT